MAESNQGPRVGFIGLGQAGGPMARVVLQAGFPLVVHDLRPGPVAELVSMGAASAGSPGLLAEQCEVILTSLPHPAISEEVLLGPGGVLSSAREGAVLIETSTVLPSFIKRVEEAARAKGVWVIDAGISGVRYAGTAPGPFLSMMVGATPEAMERAGAVLNALATRLFHVGPPGMGMTVKLVNNAMSLAHVPIFCEAIALGVKAGADPAMLYEVISQSGGSSRQFVDRFPSRVLKGNYEGGMTVELSSKDLALTLEWGKEMGVPLFVLGSIYAVHEWARAQGLGEKDRAALMTLWERLASIKVSGATGSDSAEVGVEGSARP